MKDLNRLNDVLDNDVDCDCGLLCDGTCMGAADPCDEDRDTEDGCDGCPGPDEADCKVGFTCLLFTGWDLCALPVMAIFPGQWKDLATKEPGTTEIPGPAEYICWDLCGLQAVHVVDVPKIDVAFDGILDDCEDCDSWEECRDGYCDACKML